MNDEPHQDVYFIGVALPPDLNRRVAKLKWQLYQQDPAMLPPVLPHVTLLHPPSLQGTMPSELIPQIRRIAKRYLPLTIALTDIGFFDGTVCFVQAQSLGLFSLQAQLVKLLPPAVQATHYARAYTPHVTLAQIYEPKKLNTTQLRAVIDTSFHLPLQFEVSSVTHFKRILPRVYRPSAL